MSKKRKTIKKKTEVEDSKKELKEKKNHQKI